MPGRRSQRALNLAISLSSLTLFACGGGSGSLTAQSAHILGGTINGLGNASGLVLADGSNTVAVSAGATTFTFPQALQVNTGYTVTVSSQPKGATCSVTSGGQGTMGNSNITSVVISCTATQYTVGGSISGLTASGLVLANGTDTVAVASGANSFTLSSLMAGATYAVTVKTQPTGETCTVSNGSGTIATASVTNIAVSCTITPGGSGAQVNNTTITSILYSFGASATDGTSPQASLIQASDGKFYGTTYSGGAQNAGTLFSITPSGTESILYSFTDGHDGKGPTAAPVQATDGSFYGTTSTGGSNDEGVLYAVTPAGVETVLCTFAANVNGGSPGGNLIQATDGKLYGTAADGGIASQGVLYSVDTSGTELVVYTFTGGVKPKVPSNGVIQGSDGNFYGTTTGGGVSNNGTIYSATPAGVLTVLYSFSGGADGGLPLGGLVQATDGNFYGTTQSGGTNGRGAVFKITPAGSYLVLYSFSSAASDGSGPSAGLIQASDGNLYGTTFSGGTYNSGTVFQVTLGGVEKVVYTFQGGTTDGAHPDAGLVQGSDGSFYGTTQSGGTHSKGTVFKVSNH